MNNIKRFDNVFCHWTSRPAGLIEIIGGSYISIKPEVTYKKLIQGLVQKNFAIHAWSYIPNFDHQMQANQAWKQFRFSRKSLEKSMGSMPKVIRLGHSLGCKLHFLAPDGGRNCNGQVSISFNNFKADKSIPMLRSMTKNLNTQTEFSPSPKETLNIINEQYEQINNLLISFRNDNLDQSNILLKSLQKRDSDKSQMIKIKGSHLSPVSIGLREKLLNQNSQSLLKYKILNYLVDQITKWSV
tara:strand:+ start:5787 stop:6512 length:726 start_codon:yes stop_codon:yes gene_type:complete